MYYTNGALMNGTAAFDDSRDKQRDLREDIAAKATLNYPQRLRIDYSGKK
jgi:hypothetical protein